MTLTVGSDGTGGGGGWRNSKELCLLLNNSLPQNLFETMAAKKQAMKPRYVGDCVFPVEISVSGFRKPTE